MSSLEFHEQGILCSLVSDLSLSLINICEIHPRCGISGSFLLLLSRFPIVWIDCNLFVHYLLMGIWVVFDLLSVLFKALINP